MKSTSIILMFSLWLLCCNFNQIAIRNVVNCNANITLSPLIDSLLKIYSLKYKGALYAIYFDKKQDAEYDTPEEYRLTFGHSLTRIQPEKVRCTNYTMINDTIPVYLFSGLEDFVSSKEQGLMDERTLRKTLEWRKNMSFIHVKDTSYIVDGDPYPFMNLTIGPSIIFEAPTDTSATIKR